MEYYPDSGSSISVSMRTEVAQNQHLYREDVQWIHNQQGGDLSLFEIHPTATRSAHSWSLFRMSVQVHSASTYG